MGESMHEWQVGFLEGSHKCNDADADADDDDDDDDDAAADDDDDTK